MSRNLFITGTGTDVGKTYVTALIVKKLRDNGIRAGYYKAALSGAVNDEHGNIQPGDACHVVTTAGLNDDATQLVSYMYSEPVSPHLAAQINHEPIDMAKIKRDFGAAKAHFDYVTVEGSGGIICPLRWDNQRLILDDVVKELALNVLIVADAGLGTINATVLTIEHLNKRHIPIKGVILNNYVAGDIMQIDNEKMIEEMTGVKVVARVSHGDMDLAMSFDDLIMMYD